MIEYKEYEKQVHSWLQEKHINDANFTFSVRMQGSKGAETDYFVGTKKSNYFATTFWTIPVSFPGSSGDAISLIFGSRNDYFGYNFEFTQTKTPHDNQNKLALDLIKLLKNSAIKNLGFSYASPEQNKMLTFKTKHRQDYYTTLNTMLADIDKDIEIIVPIVDAAIVELKEKNPEFIAHRITLPEYNKMQSKLEKRFLKYTTINVSDTESKIINHDIVSKKELPYNKNNWPINQILYGPPGTGKTYKTKEIAVNIAKPNFRIDILLNEKEQRESLLKAYEQLYKDGQIVFATFHQSFSYEDFIEGIKPIIEENELGEKNVIYDVIPGLFKQCCAQAGYNCYKILKLKEFEKEDYSFDDLYDKFINNYRDAEVKPIFTSISGKETEIFEINKNDSIRARARGSKANHVAPLTKENLQKLYDTFENIDKIRNLQQIKDAVGVSPRLTEFYAIFKGLKEFELHNFENLKNGQSEELKIELSLEEIIKKFDAGVFDKALKLYHESAENIVLVIDEINRGNVSAIFGELITLIEADKRIGHKEALTVKLPYSKNNFGIPQNLYIIGTMNTADRSVEALDTALRRRFSFKEVMPNPSLLETIEFEYFNLREVLETINERIEFLLDRDHTIGHSYFMDLQSGDTDGLKEVFKNKVIPLLQEYFYHDYEKIALILGSGFVRVEQEHKIEFPQFNGIDIPGPTILCEIVNDIDDIEAAVLKLLNRDGE